MIFHKSSLSVFVLSLVLFISEVFNSDIVIIACFILLLLNMYKFGLYRQMTRIIAPLLIITILGTIIGILNHGLFNRDVLRDVYKTLCPVIFILLGSYYYEVSFRKNDVFQKSIIWAALLLSMRHIYLATLSLLEFGLNFDAMRGTAGNMSMTTMVGFLLCQYLTSELNFKSKRSFKAFKFLFLISILLYLSRTMIVSLLPFLVFFFIGKRDDFAGKKLRNIIISVGLIFSLFLIFRSSDLFIELVKKFSNSFTEISSSYSSWDWVTINNNWRGYEIFLVKNQMSIANIFTKLFGFGFGELLSLGVNILLGDNYFSEIPILHNGYYYVLFKTGYIGLFSLMLFFFIRLFKQIRNFYNKKIQSQRDVIILLVGVYLAIMTSMYVISGFYNGVTLISLCITIGYYERKLFCEQKKN